MVVALAAQPLVVLTRVLVQTRYLRTRRYPLAHRGGVVDEEENGMHIILGWLQDFVAVLATFLRCHGRLADSIVYGELIAWVLD